MLRWLSFLFPKRPEFRFRILIVCRANITRSPTIAGLLRKRLEEDFPEVMEEIGIASAGVQGFHRAAADPVMRFMAQQAGVDLLPHSSQPVSARLIRDADLVLTLEEAHARQIVNRFRDTETKVFPLPKFGNSDLQPREWDIPDPTGKEAEEYTAFLEEADRQVNRILVLLEGQIRNSRENVVLIGNPGVGKSTLGRALAEETGWDFLDTDDLIEVREGCSLQSIVDRDGYLKLREIEGDLLQEIQTTQTVIATGGSAVYSTEAMTHLRQLGPIVWLQAEYETLQARIGDAADRGLAKPPDQTLEELFTEREDLYGRWAEVRILTSGQKPEDLVTELQKDWSPG